MQSTQGMQWQRQKLYARRSRLRRQAEAAPNPTNATQFEADLLLALFSAS